MTQRNADAHEWNKHIRKHAQAYEHAQTANRASLRDPYTGNNTHGVKLRACMGGGQTAGVREPFAKHAFVTFASQFTFNIYFISIHLVWPASATMRWDPSSAST